MNAVVRSNDTLPAPVSETASLLEVISRAASDPSVDVDKMERLLQMKERMDARDSEAAFNQAMADAQADMGRIAANAENSQTRSKYATYDKLDKVLRPIYGRHGFALSFDEGEAPADHVLVLCHVSHRAGHTRIYKKLMPADGKGAKGGDVMTKTHAAGAAMSYAMRYLLKGIFNVAIGEEDRDGNQVLPTLTQKQAADLKALLEETGSDVALFKRWAKVDSLDQILAKNFDLVCREIRARSKGRAAQ